MEKMVLVVDDSEDMGQIITYMLQREGITVEYASNENDAIRKLNIKPNLIILDYFLNRSTPSKLIELAKDIPIILLSGQHNLNEFAKKINAAAYILKPFAKQSFLDTVHKCIKC